MEFRQLMNELAERIGIQGGLKPDAEGVYRMGRDGIAVSVLEVPEDESILVYAEVCELPVEGADEFKTALLQANFMGRGTPDGAFSLSEDGHVVLHRYVNAARTDAEGLQKVLEAFLRIMLNWRQLADDYRPLAKERAERRSEEKAVWANYV